MKWTPLFAAAFCVLHTHAKQGSNSESLPSRGAKFGPAFCTREPVLDPHAFPPPSPLALLTSVSSNNLMNQTYIKGTTRLRAKMASPSLLSQISCRGASDPILISDKTARQTVQGADQPTRSTLSASSPGYEDSTKRMIVHTWKRWTKYISPYMHRPRPPLRAPANKALLGIVRKSTTSLAFSALLIR